MNRLLVVAAIVGSGCTASDETTGQDPTFDSSTGNDAELQFDASNDTAGDAPVIPDPPYETRTFTEDDAAFNNPERGWMDGSGIGLTDGASYETIRSKNFTLAYAKVRLDSYKSSALPKTFLDALDAGFGRVRAAGIKVVLRFVYNDGTGGDAPEARVLEHIAQLGPIVGKNIDAIAVWQAGLIGAWGEWHSSTNGLDNPTSHKKIVQALLAALPKERMIQIRTPHFKGELWKDPTPESLWFSAEDQARVGHHNDCFLASATDEGTYVDPVATWKDWLEKDIKALPMGGESCRKTTLTACDNAKRELARFRWSFYNPYWHPDVFTQWAAEGCRDEIGKKLGYRLVLEEAAFGKSIAPGGVLPLKFRVKNVGYAPLFNPRPVKVVLDDGKTRHVATLAVDPRRWMPGTSQTVMVRLRVPASVPLVKARLELWLPDASNALMLRPEYSVRFASKGIWDEKRGTNLLTDALPIDPSAPGGVDPTAKDFAPIP
jgi:hypothetical protein